MDNWNPGERNVRWGAVAQGLSEEGALAPQRPPPPHAGSAGRVTSGPVTSGPRASWQSRGGLWGFPTESPPPGTALPHVRAARGDVTTGSGKEGLRREPRGLRGPGARSGLLTRSEAGSRGVGDAASAPAPPPARSCGRRSGPLLVSQNEARWRQQGSWALWRRRLGRGRAAPPSQSPFCGHEQTPLTRGRGLGALAVLGPGRPSSSRGRQVCGVGAHGCHGDAAAEKCGRG